MVELAKYAAKREDTETAGRWLVRAADAGDEVAAAVLGRPTEASTNEETTGTTDQATGDSEKKKKEGCYIATAVYGSYDSPEVLELRKFRDATLRRSALGRCFIRTY